MRRPILATALDEQVRVVFARALSTPGPVAVSDVGSAATEHTVRFSIGETMLAAFRLDVPLEVVSGFVHAMLDKSVKLRATAVQLDALKLRPAELRLVRQLGTGATGLATTDLPARTEQEIPTARGAAGVGAARLACWPRSSPVSRAVESPTRPRARPVRPAAL